MDIKNFYFNTQMARKEYLCLRIFDMPEDVIEEYGFQEKATTDGYVYVAISKWMYGLSQAGILAQQLVEERLGKEGYFQSKSTSGLWSHEWRPVQLSLVVDDFGVKNIGKEHAEHLVGVIKKNYEMTTDREGERYCGLTLEYDYVKRDVHLFMPGHIDNALHPFNHMRPKQLQNQPHKHVPPTMKQKYNMQNLKTNPPLNNDDKASIQQVTGVFFCSLEEQGIVPY